MIGLGPVIPVLRIFDEAAARDFYMGFLGFEVLFEHRFGDDFPLYMGVCRCACVLHLSGHHGDATPGSSVRIETKDVTGFSAELGAKKYRYAKPGAPELKPWGHLELVLTDPFANRLIFWEPTIQVAGE